ncbi:MAG: SRPBCC family protein [Myxococcales bacterium]|nr:SRPBCC family protein [Myxococcales bacterium]
MPVVTESLTIAAPAPDVFRTITEVERFPETTPAVTSIEFIGGEGFEGVGTRFRETRDMGKGKTLVTELEVVEYDADQRTVRMVADTHGTIWDTTMSVEERPEGSHLTIRMDARGSTWFRRMMNRVMAPLFRKGIRDHLHTLKARLES